MPDIPYSGIDGNEVTDDELWVHRLGLEDADDVWEGPAKYFPQPAQWQELDDGTLRLQPARTLMIGPDAGGRLLTFILELPDERDVSHVVTGWVSDDDERARYYQPGGRTRQR